MAFVGERSDYFLGAVGGQKPRKMHFRAFEGQRPAGGEKSMSTRLRPEPRMLEKKNLAPKAIAIFLVSFSDESMLLRAPGSAACREDNPLSYIIAMQRTRKWSLSF